ncbi:TPA: hypothetical protein ACQ99M_001254 [Streptococcus pyogenes]
MTYFRLKKELNWSLRNKGIVVYEGNQKLQIAINTGKNNSEKVFFDTFLRWFGRQRLSPQEKTSVLVLAYFVRRNRKSGITLAE